MPPSDLRPIEPDPEQELCLMQWVVQFEKQRFDVAEINLDIDAMEDALDYECSARTAQMKIEGGMW